MKKILTSLLLPLTFLLLPSLSDAATLNQPNRTRAAVQAQARAGNISTARTVTTPAILQNANMPAVVQGAQPRAPTPTPAPTGADTTSEIPNWVTTSVSFNPNHRTVPTTRAVQEYVQETLGDIQRTLTLINGTTN